MDARHGDNASASVAYAQAVQLASLTSDGLLNNHICGIGSTQGFAQIVLPACDRAVAIELDGANARDFRGLARALTGDTEGAIADFTAYVQWTREHYAYDRWGARRDQWIQELKQGRNPFDAETLAQLRDE